MGRKPCRLQASCLPVVILVEDHTAPLKNNLNSTIKEVTENSCGMTYFNF